MNECRYCDSPELPVQTGLAVIPILSAVAGILGTASSGGWFSGAEWAGDIIGKSTNGNATGGLVQELEDLTGRVYPELRDLREEAARTYRTVYRSFLWARPPAIQKYETAVRDLANAVAREAEAYEREQSVSGKFTTATTVLGEAITSSEWWKRYLPWIGMGVIGTAIILLFARRK